MKHKRKCNGIKFVFIFLFLIHTQAAKAWLMDGGAGWVNATYLAQILLESIKQYQQLKMILKENKGHDRYIRALNAGLQNSMGLVSVLPIKDEQLLNELKNFQQAIDHLSNVYGEIPKSSDEGWQRLQDQVIAEGLKMAANIEPYTQKQEENSLKLFIQAREASPQGAARMAVESNAQILHSINQLIKINAQMLKMQGENMASSNRDSKLATRAQLKTMNDVSGKLKMASGDFMFPSFSN